MTGLDEKAKVERKKRRLSFGHSSSKQCLEMLK
jgi:hypothetical protein